MRLTFLMACMFCVAAMGVSAEEPVRWESLQFQQLIGTHHEPWFRMAVITLSVREGSSQRRMSPMTRRTNGGLLGEYGTWAPQPPQYRRYIAETCLRHDGHRPDRC